MSREVQPLRLGTRRSQLALAQAHQVAAAVTASSARPVELVEIGTPGDASDAPITELPTVGVFVSSLRTALLDGRIDVAVHSYKDLPTAPEPGLVIAAIPVREDPRDALVTRHPGGLLDLPAGARIGTGSPRRAAQLRALDLGLDVAPIRGNVDSRLAAVGPDLDGVVLARAGLARLGRSAEISETLDPMQMLPAPAQGALAIECRAEDEPARAILGRLDDADSRAAVTAERSLLAVLEAGCSAPVGALCEVAEGEDGPELFLRGRVTALDGSAEITCSGVADPTSAADLGARVAADLLDRGAADLMNGAAASAAPSTAPDQHDPASPSGAIPTREHAVGMRNSQ